MDEVDIDVSLINIDLMDFRDSIDLIDFPGLYVQYYIDNVDINLSIPMILP